MGLFCISLKTYYQYARDGFLDVMANVKVMTREFFDMFTLLWLLQLLYSMSYV